MDKVVKNLGGLIENRCGYRILNIQTFNIIIRLHSLRYNWQKKNRIPFGPQCDFGKVTQYDCNGKLDFAEHRYHHLRHQKLPLYWRSHLQYPQEGRFHLPLR